VPVEQETGLTPSERYLGKLCRASFLSLWSYPNLYTDKGVTERNRLGKELCDLLVIFENNIIIFSDKSCQVPDTGDVSLDWKRWYKRAIKRSADQIFGAERWLAEFPKRIFLDPLCTKPFPLDVPSPQDWTVHRIVVALGAGERAAKYFGGGSRGSLMLVPSIVGDKHLSDELPAGPFRVGEIEPSKGFVHIFDDVTLDIVMREVDTISDFVDYLQRKADFLRSGRVFMCHGEEEALAYYLSNLDDQQNPSFELPLEAKIDPTFKIVLSEGLWDEYKNGEFFAIKSELQSAGAFVDTLIEGFSEHILDGTLAYGNERGLKNHERNVRFLAAEPRRQRAMMAHAMLQKMSTTPRNVRSSVVLKSTLPDTMFVFLLLPKDAGQSQHNYRIQRQDMLEAYAHVVKFQNPTVKHVYGIATEPGLGNRGRSEDLMSFDFSEWTEADDIRAKQIQDAGRILVDVNQRSLFFDPPNTSRPELAFGNRKERRKAKALARRQPSGPAF
jgi:hypothetical protein